MLISIPHLNWFPEFHKYHTVSLPLQITWTNARDPICRIQQDVSFPRPCLLKFPMDSRYLVSVSNCHYFKSHCFQMSFRRSMSLNMKCHPGLWDVTGIRELNFNTPSELLVRMSLFDVRNPGVSSPLFKNTIFSLNLLVYDAYKYKCLTGQRLICYRSEWNV